MSQVSVLLDEGVELEEALLELLEKQLTLLMQQAEIYDQSTNLLLTLDEPMRRMNLEYRGKDKTTDILSFPYPEGEELLGELAISLPVAVQQAQENGWDVPTELARLLVHGFCHLLGYDHEISEEDEREMLLAEVKLLKSLGLEGIYPGH